MVIDEANEAAEKAGRRRGGKRFGNNRPARSGMHAGIGDQLAIRPVDERLRVRRRLGELVEQGLREVRVDGRLAPRIVLHGGLRKRAGVNPRLFAQGRNLRVEQALLILVQVEKGGENQRDRKQVHEQDIAQQAGDSWFFSHRRCRSPSRKKGVKERSGFAPAKAQASL